MLRNNRITKNYAWAANAILKYDREFIMFIHVGELLTPCIKAIATGQMVKWSNGQCQAL